MPQIVVSSDADSEGYVTHTLDGPYDGWVYNDEARIRLHGQDRFQLAGSGAVVLDTPPDLVAE